MLIPYVSTGKIFSYYFMIFFIMKNILILLVYQIDCTAPYFYHLTYLSDSNNNLIEIFHLQYNSSIQLAYSYKIIGKLL